MTFRSHLDYENVDKFVSVIALGSPPGIPSRTKVYWANGVLFRYFSMPQSETVAKEILNGNLVWDHIEFDSMPDNEKEISGISERPLMSIYGLDVSNHVVFNPLTRWIKENLM